MCGCPGAAGAECHKLGGLEHQAFLSHRAGSRSPRPLCWQGRLLPEAPRGGPSLASLPADWPMHPCNVCLLPHVTSPPSACGSPSPPAFSYQDASYGTPYIQGDLILRPLNTSAETLFPNKVTFTGTGGGLGRTNLRSNIQPICAAKGICEPQASVYFTVPRKAHSLLKKCGDSEQNRKLSPRPGVRPGRVPRAPPPPAA